MTDAQKWLVFSGIIFTGWLLFLLAPVLTPFLVAALLAYLGDPIADRFEKLHLSRTISVLIVFALMLLVGLVILLVLLPILQEQLIGLMLRLPQIINTVQEKIIPLLLSALGMQPDAIVLDDIKHAIMENWRDIGSILGTLLDKFSSSGQTLLVWLAYLVLIPVVTFYLLRDWDILVENIHGLIPKRFAASVTQIAKECDSVLDEFLHGQLLVMVSLGLIYSIGLWLIGLEFSLLIGMMAGIVSFVPYLGSIVGVAVAGIVAFMQFQDILHLVFVGIVFAVGQGIEGMILSPLLIGDRIGLHPVAVIFAVMAGGQLFGFLGVLLALPAAAVIKVLLAYFHEHYVQSDFYTP